MFKTEVFQVHTLVPQLREKFGELAWCVIDDNNQGSELGGDAMLARQLGNPSIAGVEQLRNRAARTSRPQVAERLEKAVNIGFDALEVFTDGFGVGLDNLNPQSRVTRCNARDIPNSPTGKRQCNR